MRTTINFPHYCKKIGWALFIPGCIVGLLALTTNEQLLDWHLTVPAVFNDGLSAPAGYFSMINAEITLTVSGVLLIIGGLLLVFSRAQDEDEFLAQLRLSCLQWAVFVNYALLLLAFLTVYGAAFLLVLPLHIFTVIILFVARFEYAVYKNRKLRPDEKYA